MCTMEINSVDTKVIELQKQVQKLEKLEKMIDPNSKKALILWDDEEKFKSLITGISEYAMNCDTDEFPVELLEKLNTLKTNVETQLVEDKEKVEVLQAQVAKNAELSRTLYTMYISARTGTPLDEYEESLISGELDSVKEYLNTIRSAVPETEEYIKAEKGIKSKISNLENSVHLTIDLERMTGKYGALEYIKTQITPSIERLQAEYDVKYATTDSEIDEEMSLALRKSLKEKVYDAVIKPFTSFFKWKKKIKN